MRSKKVLDALKKALQQDYLYDAEELKFMKEQLLVLEEASSALDNRTEAEVMNAIEIIGRRCTIVTIAHRLSTIERSDCIYEFKDGEIELALNMKR